MSEIKITIKYGDFELQVESNNTEAIKIFENPVLRSVSINDKMHQHYQMQKPQDVVHTNSTISMSMIGIKLNAKTASQMIVAALAFLTITSEDSKTFSSRYIINDAMKSATYHYKKNLSSHLKRVIKLGEISIHGYDQYTFLIDKLEKMRLRLV